MAPKRKSAFASQQVAKAPKRTLNASATSRRTAPQSQAVNDMPDEDDVPDPTKRVLRARGADGKAQVATSASKTFRDISEALAGPVKPGPLFEKLQKMPAEVQIEIWKHAQRSSPAVHFCRATAVETLPRDRDNTTCSLKLTRVQKNTDDSAWRINTPLSQICATARRASFILPEKQALLRLSRGTHRINGHTDLLCLKLNVGDEFGKPHHIWPRGNPIRIPWAPIDHDAVKQQMRGFHKIGLWNAPRDPWRRLTCLTMANAMGVHTCRHREIPFAICPIQLAGFIDSCPDIEEFYLVVPKHGVTPKSNSLKAQIVRAWSRSRKSMIFRYHYHNQRFKYTNHDVCGRRSVP
jgi:hypothetical protein